MKKTEDLDRLVEMSAMVFDLRAQTLKEARAAKAKVEAQLAALDVPQSPAEAAVDLLQAGHAYQRWAAARRAVLMTQLAARHADCAIAEGEAKRAFGRKLALAALRAKE